MCDYRIPTMKSLDGGKKENKASKNSDVENDNKKTTKNEVIDFSNVKIEPLFEETVDFETFSSQTSEQLRLRIV